MAKSEKLEFQTEVSQLLKLMINSVYSEKEVFVRELVSNASDACDKLRYLATTKEKLLQSDPDLKIQIEIDKIIFVPLLELSCSKSSDSSIVKLLSPSDFQIHNFFSPAFRVITVKSDATINAE